MDGWESPFGLNIAPYLVKLYRLSDPDAGETDSLLLLKVPTFVLKVQQWWRGGDFGGAAETVKKTFVRKTFDSWRGHEIENERLLVVSCRCRSWSSGSGVLTDTYVMIWLNLLKRVCRKNYYCNTSRHVHVSTPGGTWVQNSCNFSQNFKNFHIILPKLQFFYFLFISSVILKPKVVVFVKLEILYQKFPFYKKTAVW